MRRGLPKLLCLWLVACGAEVDRAPALNTAPPAALASRFYPPEGWTWGLVQVPGAPPHRYGVGGPRRASRGHIVIVAGFAEPAEKWFETANALIAEGWTVWTLDLAGQGGSGRAADPRDMAHVRDMAVDVEALRLLVVQAIRPAPEDRVVVLAHSLGSAATLLALSGGLTEVDAAILSAPTVIVHPQLLPRTEGEMQTASVWARRVGLGDRFAWDQDGWTYSEIIGPPVTHDPVRREVQREWMRANPDLRIGGVSWGWTAAFFEHVAAARDPATLHRVQTSITVLAPDDDGWAAPGSAATLCRALPRCRLVAIAGSRHEPHMEVDPVRDRWLAAVREAAGGGSLSPAVPPR